MAVINDQKKIIDMSFNVAIMGSFAIPGAGAVIAAVLASGQFFFDLFCPGAQVDRRDVPATTDELDKAVDNIKKATIDALWWSRIETVKTKVLGEHDLFTTNWNKLGAIQATELVVDNDITGIKKSFVVGAGDADFISDADTYFNLGNNSGTGSLLAGYGYSLTLRTASDKDLDATTVLHHQTRTTSFYCLIASLTISYYKAAVIWRWGHDQVLLYQEWLAYWEQSSLWDGHADPKDPWRSNHEKLKPNKPTKPDPGRPDWNSWVHSASSPVSDCLTAIDKALLYALGDGTDDNPGLCAKMSDNWKKSRYQKVADRVAKLSLQSKVTQYGTRYYYVDAEHGDISSPTDTRAVAELHMEAKRGALIAYEWNFWTQVYGLDGVELDDLQAFGRMIDLWKRARQSIDFVVYTTVQGDTLPGIAAMTVIDGQTTPATKGYGNADLSPIIFGANRDKLDTLDDVLAADIVLRIPNLKTYTVVANDTLITIAAKPNIYFNGDLYPVIFNANRDILKDPNVISTGQVLRIPDLNYSQDSIHTVLAGDTLVSIARNYYGHGDFYLKIFEANKDVLKDANTLVLDQKLTIPGLDPVLGSVEWCDASDFYRIYSMLDYSQKPAKPRFNSLRDAAVEMFGNPDLSLKIFDLNSSLWTNLSDPNAFPDLTSTTGQMRVPQLAYRALSGESLDAIAVKFYGANPPSNGAKAIAKINGLTMTDVLTSGQKLTILPRFEV